MSAYTRRRRRRRLVPILLLLAAAYLGGLYWFVQSIPWQRPDGQGPPTDAIVVLTGAVGRIPEGLDLLDKERGRKLFISGVYRGVEVQQLLQMAQRQPDEMLCCITLGYEAQDTVGNAEETAAWITANDFDSFTLVTSAQHMPRSLLLFHHALPDSTIVPHPVYRQQGEHSLIGYWARSADDVFQEYNKFLLTRLRLFFVELLDAMPAQT